MLQINQLSFSYPNEAQDVLKNIDFSLESGKILAIVGPSGCGKTTLLKLIYGLLTPSQGDIKWHTEVIPNPKDVLVPGFSKMKFVEQDFNLMPYIKVYENMQQHILHLTEEEREPILKYWLDFLKIQHIETKKAKDLSGGQMIKKRIPGEGKMYDFEGDTNEIKEKIRAIVSDDMAEEANWVFDSATQLFQQLMEIGLEHTLEPSDTVSE